MASNITAQPSSPGMPQPGPIFPAAVAPLPVFTFSPSPSLCQQGGNLIAVGGNPGVAGPVATVPTTQMQDFGQPMGQTGNIPVLPSTAQGGSP